MVTCYNITKSPISLLTVREIGHKITSYYYTLLLSAGGYRYRPKHLRNAPTVFKNNSFIQYSTSKLTCQQLLQKKLKCFVKSKIASAICKG